MMKLRKIKAFIVAFAMVAAMSMPSTFAYAVEASEDKLEVSKDEKRHTVAVYGKAVAIIYPDGQMVIVANNLSGRVDVMLDGKVTKGIGTVVVPAQNRTNMVLEEGSFIANAKDEEQADMLKEVIKESLLTDQPIESSVVIEDGEEMQNVTMFLVGKSGEIQAEDGTKISTDALTGVEVKTPQIVYEEFAAEMEEKIQEEQEKIREEQQAAAERGQEDKSKESEFQGTPSSSQGNGITGVCSHEWEPAGTIDGGEHDGASVYRCKKCGITRI